MRFAVVCCLGRCWLLCGSASAFRNQTSLRVSFSMSVSAWAAVCNYIAFRARRTTHTPRARLGGPLVVFVLCVRTRWHYFEASPDLQRFAPGIRRFGATMTASSATRLMPTGDGSGAAVPEAKLLLVSTMWARGGGLASVACLGPLAPTSCWRGRCCRSRCAVCVEALPGMAGIRALAECS